jgi:hypothetical protein
MKDIPRVLPLSVVLLLIILFAMCGCRGGRSLGKGSAGTVIIPQTPQEINERNRPVFEPLPPIPIVPPQSNPIVSTNAVRSTPTPPKHAPIKANPIIVDPKPVGELTPFRPTVSTNLLTKLPPVKTEKLPSKIVEGDGGCVIITPNPKNPQTDNKATAEANGFPLCDPMETAETESFNWAELLLNYLLFIIIAIFIWTIYDIFKNKKTPAKKAIKSRRRASKNTKTTKKKGSKKKLEEYKKEIPSGWLWRGKN